MGEDVKFVITNTDTGHYQVHRTRIVPFLPDTEPSNSLGGFPPGANVEGCMTNFANGHTSCYRNVVEPGGVDFYVSAGITSSNDVFDAFRLALHHYEKSAKSVA